MRERMREILLVSKYFNFAFRFRYSRHSISDPTDDPSPESLGEEASNGTRPRPTWFILCHFYMILYVYLMISYVYLMFVFVWFVWFVIMRVISRSFFPLIKLQWAFLCLCIYPQRAWLVGEVEAFLQPKKAIAVVGNFIIQLILTAQCKPNFRNMGASLTSASCVSSSLSFVKGHCSLIIELLPLHLFIFIFALCVFFPLFFKCYSCYYYIL